MAVMIASTSDRSNITTMMLATMGPPPTICASARPTPVPSYIFGSSKPSRPKAPCKASGTRVHVTSMINPAERTALNVSFFGSLNSLV